MTASRHHHCTHIPYTPPVTMLHSWGRQFGISCWDVASASWDKKVRCVERTQSDLMVEIKKNETEIFKHVALNAESLVE